MNTLSFILKPNSLFYVSRIFQQDVLTGRTDESQVPSDEEHKVFAGFTIEEIGDMRQARQCIKSQTAPRTVAKAL